ncbi:MAG: hypothetical protein PHW04_03025 [Candidatus Wallbacteria bacterium]|nr:hypothetical protein [Candidatus Wallbacteria bacterium]
MLASVIDKILISPQILELIVEFPEPVDAKPGQYGMFDLGPEFTLARAFSIGSKLSDRRYGFFIRQKGRGTEKLFRESLDSIEVFFPLGNGFELVSGLKIQLIAGGSGIFPLVYLASLLKKSNQVTLLFGAKTDQEIVLLDRFGVKTIICTEEGLKYQKGLITDYCESGFDRWYVCGPKGMCAALFKKLPKDKTFYSMEEKFACGYGVCLGCSIRTAGGMRRVCKDGPVFSGKELCDDSFR